MKFIVIILTIGLFLFYPLTSPGTDGKEPMEVTLKPVEDAIGVRFYIKVNLPGNLIVRIKNQDHEVLFQQSYSGSKNYKGIFNLENLRDGRYFFEVRQGSEVYKQEINLREQSQRYVSIEH